MSIRSLIPVKRLGVSGAFQKLWKLVAETTWVERSWGYILVSLPIFGFLLFHIVCNFLITMPVLLVWALIEGRRNIAFLSDGARSILNELTCYWDHDDEEGNEKGGLVKDFTSDESDDKRSCNVTMRQGRRPQAAVRLAFFAISTVGYLDNTKVNAKIYEKVILKKMDEIGMRYTDRVRILPMAVVACFIKDQEVADTYEVLSAQMSGGACVR